MSLNHRKQVEQTHLPKSKPQPATTLRESPELRGKVRDIASALKPALRHREPDRDLNEPQ